MATWNISQMEDYIVGPEGSVFAGEARVVFTVHWQCVDSVVVGEGEDAVTHHARVYSSQSLQPFTEGEAFVEWESVTEEIALGWLHTKMGEDEVTRIEESVTDQLDAKMNPTTSSGVPWS